CLWAKYTDIYYRGTGNEWQGAWFPHRLFEVTQMPNPGCRLRPRPDSKHPPKKKCQAHWTRLLYFRFASTKNGFDSGRRRRRKFFKSDLLNSKGYLPGLRRAVSKVNFDGQKNATWTVFTFWCWSWFVEFASDRRFLYGNAIKPSIVIGICGCGKRSQSLWIVQPRMFR